MQQKETSGFIQIWRCQFDILVTLSKCCDFLILVCVYILTPNVICELLSYKTKFASVLKNIVLLHIYLANIYWRQPSSRTMRFGVICSFY